MTERELLKDLINRWTEYLNKNSNPTIEGFCSSILADSEDQFNHNETTQSEVVAVKMELGYYMGRIINFTDLWGKLAFKDLPIRQFEDFGLLAEVKEKGNPSKMELARVLVNEKSTAIERIKRLVRQRLLSEEIDQNDKRIRRVKITFEGDKVLKQAYVQAMKVSQLLTWPIGMEQTKSLLAQFKKLDHFHTDIYENKDYTSIDDLI